MGVPMAMGRPKEELVLRPEQREQLESLASSRSLPAGLVSRARIILLSASGKTNRQIAHQLGLTNATVGKWRRRFMEQDVSGLHDELRPGRPRPISDERVAQLVRKTLETKPKDGTHWTIRQIAEQTRLSKSTVHRIWQAFGLEPHRQRQFKLSNDPFFVEKVRDIVGLYLNPPENAMVLCVDEKSGIQALERTQPLLPLSAKKPRSWTNEYVRHGTQTLLAALEIASGQVVAHVKQRRTSVNFLRFFKDVITAFPERELHMILDNLNIHKNHAARNWLQRHPRVHFHYTPTHASWVNMVECFFSIMGKQALSQSVHTSKRQLKE